MMEPARHAHSRRLQRTIARETEVRGVGFLHGSDVTLRFRPAGADRASSSSAPTCPSGRRCRAHIRHVIPRQRRTTIQHGAASVEMIEHVMAALAGLADRQLHRRDRRPRDPGLRRVEPGVRRGARARPGSSSRTASARPWSSTARSPSARGGGPGGPSRRAARAWSSPTTSTTAATSPIGAQSFFVDVSPETFRDELATSRTFLLEAEAHALRAAGIGSRTTAADLLIFGADGVIGNVLRYPDECVRHKILDMVGDLALLGMDLSGHVVAHRSGHQLNAALVRKLLEAVERERLARTGTAPGRRNGDGYRGDHEDPAPRYPFLLVDRVLEHEPGRRVLALKNVSVNEPFFQGHWPGRPIMPGVLIVEALAQAGGILIADSIDSKRPGGPDRRDRRRQAPPAGRPGRPAPAGSDRPAAQVEPRRCPRRGQGRRPGGGRGQDAVHDRR